ncbi:MAG: chemotaxis protein CheW [Spirochaetota bacterium]
MENIQEQTILQPVNDKSANNIVQYLTFFVGKETYGIAVEQVKEVIEYHQVYKLPKVPPYIRGVINLRGEILPVIDLSYLFYSRKSEISPSTGIIFLECKTSAGITVLGVIIDSVESVTDIQSGNIESEFSFGEKIRHDYIDGVGKVDGRFIILLNIKAVLNIEELSKFNSGKVIH